MGMDRKEFCELMAKAKKESGIRSIDISRHFQMDSTQLYRFEKGASSFSMVQAISYLDFLGFHITLIKPEECIELNNYFIFPSLLKKWRGTTTKSSLARSIGTANTAINVLEKEISVAGIDTFLKIINHFGYILAIENTKKPLFSDSYKIDEDKFYQMVTDIKNNSVSGFEPRRSPSEKRVIEIAGSGKGGFSLTILFRYLQLFKYHICLNNSEGSWLFSELEHLIEWLNNRIGKVTVSYVATQIGVRALDLGLLDGRKKDMNVDVLLKLVGALGLSITFEKKEKIIK